MRCDMHPKGTRGDQGMPLYPVWKRTEAGLVEVLKVVRGVGVGPKPPSSRAMRGHTTHFGVFPPRYLSNFLQPTKLVKSYEHTTPIILL